MKINLKIGNSRGRENNKPRILTVGPIFPVGGGVGMVNKILLESRGLNESFEIDHLNTNRGKAGADKVATLAPINLVYFIGQTFNLLKILVIKRPRILHQSVSWGIAFWKEAFFMLLGRCFGVKIIAHIHGSKLDVQFRKGNKIQRKMMRIAFDIPHKIIVLSESWRMFLIGEVSEKLDVVIIPNSIDFSIANAMERHVSNTKKKECLVLFLGWLSVRKGLLDALHAADLIHKCMPEVHFVFAGNIEPGPDREMIETACGKASKNENITFPGLVTGEGKISLLSRASIFILPSYHENLPVAILEAMAMGLPIVSTAIAGIPELIEDGKNGFLIQPGDYSALADRIIQLIQDPELCQTMEEANIAKIRNMYHPRVFEMKMSTLYQDLLRTG
jgi:glycosyltransferase involved in cell wall biosynthesis